MILARWLKCAVFLLLIGQISMPACADTARGKSSQLLGNVWASQILKHEQSVEELRKALQGDIKNLVKELKQKKAEVIRNPDCKSLDCKHVGEMVQTMYRLQDRAKMSWIMADVSRQWLSNYIDYGDSSLSAMRKSASTVEWANFLQDIAQSTADVAAAIAISLYTGDPSSLTASLQIIGSEIGNFGVNKAADLTTGYQSAAGAGGEKGAAYLGGGTIARDVANNLTGSLSGVGVFSVSKNGMRYGFSPSAKGLTKLGSAKGAVATLAVQAVLHALTAHARAGVKKDLARVQKQLQQVMEEQVYLRIALVMQEKNVEEMRRHHTEVAELSTMLQNVRDACKEVGKRKNCVDKFQTAVDKARTEREAKVGPLLKQRNMINQEYKQARKQFSARLLEVEKIFQALRQAMDKLSRAETLWKNRAAIEDIALHARDSAKRQQYQKELDELHKLGNPAPYRKDVERLSKLRTELWKKIDSGIKHKSALGRKRLNISARTNDVIRAADEVFGSAVARARDQLAVCTTPDYTPAHRSKVSPDRIKALRGQRGALLPDQYYTLLEQAMEELDEDLSRTHIKIKTSGNCKEEKNRRTPQGSITTDNGELKNISGCWTDHAGRQITIRQDGSRVSVDHPFYGRTFTGSLNRSQLVLRYLFKNTQDIAAVWKRTTGNSPPLKALNQVPIQSRYLGFDFEVTEEGKLRGVFRTLYVSYDRGTDTLDYAETRSDPMEWLRRKVKLQSIQVTDRAFGHSLNEVRPDAVFWIAAKSASNCAGVQDRTTVTLYPGGKESEKIDMELVETGPDTSEFHSVKSVSVASLKAKPGQKIIVRSGLRGTSIRVRDISSRPKLPKKTMQTQKTAVKHDTLKRKRENEIPSKQTSNSVADRAASRAAAGTGSGSSQLATPVRDGLSRKHAGVPVKSQTMKQTSEKPVQWTAYKLESFAGRNGGLPKMNIIKVAFRRSAKLVQLHVKSYPVSLSRNDRTGEILWSVDWSNGDIEDQQMSSNPSAMDMIQQQAEALRRGTVARTGLAALINGRLGSKAGHL